MELVFLVINGVGMILDLLVILLDVNFFLVSTFLSVVIWLIALVYNLPNATVTWVTQFWNWILIVLLCIAEVFYSLALALVQAVINLLRGFCSSMESLKVLGHLVTHLTMRGKEIMHRSLWNLVGSGQSLLRQVCEVCAIVMSLVAYFINSIINICLIGTQNLFAVGLALWDTIVGPFLRVTDILVAFAAHLSSSALAIPILLWTPCQLAFDLLVSASKLVINIFLLDLYGVGLLSVMLATSVVILNPQLTWTLVHQVSGYLNTMPFYHRLLRDLRHLYQIVLLSLEMVLNLQTWRRLADWSLQVIIWNRNGWGGHQPQDQEEQLALEASQERPEGAAGAQRPAPMGAAYLRRQGPAVTPRAHQRGNRDQHRTDIDLGTATQRSVLPDQPLRPQGDRPSGSHIKLAKKEHLNALEDDNDPWLLLKEQEERKKCVICQDQTKTVLLLPCRHLCLCQQCTEILLQQAVYQRNCPLCRQVILQTLDVYL